MTTATSSDAPHREHRWPGETRANLSFPFRSISAGTVCVQMGHRACPLVWLSIIAFISLALHLIGRFNPCKSCTGIVKNLKEMYNLETRSGSRLYGMQSILLASLTFVCALGAKTCTLEQILSAPFLWLPVTVLHKL
jgi:hypothetical protein